MMVERLWALAVVLAIPLAFWLALKLIGRNWRKR